jgi:hypothetical protein
MLHEVFAVFCRAYKYKLYNNILLLIQSQNVRFIPLRRYRDISIYREKQITELRYYAGLSLTYSNIAGMGRQRE